jgi:O-antigen/teichoic acid export membrane protein
MSSYSVAQNTSFLTIASIGQKIISGVYFFIVSWFIAEGKTEIYFATFAAIAIFTVVADFGLGSTFTREIAQKPEKTVHYIHVIFALKLMLGIGTVGLLFLSSVLFKYPSQNLFLILVAGLTLFSDSIRNIFYGVLRVKNNLKYESYGTVAAQFLSLLIGSIALILRADLIWLVVPFLIASTLHTLYAMWCMYRHTQISFAWEWDGAMVKTFLLLSLPFAISGLFAQLYSYQDSIIIKHFLPSIDGDNWARAYKAAFAFQFIPTSLVATLYPRISALYVKKDENLQRLVLGSYRYLLLISVPLAFGTAAFIQPFFERFAHRFIGAAPILEILIFSVIFSYSNYIHFNVLNATHRQTIQTLLIGGALIFSVIANILIIPRWGTGGAAFIAVMSSVLVAIFGYMYTKHIISFPHKAFFKLVAQVMVPGLALYAVGKFLVMQGHLLGAMAAGKIIAEQAIAKGLPEERVVAMDTSAEAMHVVHDLVEEGSLVLVKGSQGVRLEKVVKEIMAEPMKARDLLCRQDDTWLRR